MPDLGDGDGVAGAAAGFQGGWGPGGVSLFMTSSCCVAAAQGRGTCVVMAAPALSSALPCAPASPTQTELSYQGWLPLPCQLNWPQKYWPAQLDWHWSQLVMPYVSSAAPLPLVHWQS